MHRSRTANLLGAAAQGLSDHIHADLSGAAQLSDSAVATLIVLSDSSGIGASELGRRLGITQSAAVRIIEGLERDGLLQRGPKAGRNVAITLTGQGQGLARDLLEARERSLGAVVNSLAPEEQEQPVAPVPGDSGRGDARRRQRRGQRRRRRRHQPGPRRSSR